MFALKESGFIYSRIGNPTVDVLEKRLATLEGGVAAVCTSSGLSAQAMAITTIMKSGDNFVSSSKLYGGSHNQFKILFKRFGSKLISFLKVVKLVLADKTDFLNWILVEVKFVDGDDPKAFERVIDDNTKAIYLESCSNPAYNIPDFEAFAQLAHSHKM